MTKRTLKHNTKTREKQKYKEFKKRLILFSFILLISVMLIFLGATIFYSGYHNTDLGQNIRYINAEFGLNLKEASMGSAIKTTSVNLSGAELYSLGIMQMKQGFLISCMGWLLFGMVLMLLLYLGRI